jgi:hypothetical protein
LLETHNKPYTTTLYFIAQKIGNLKKQRIETVKNHSIAELKSFVEITQVWNFSKFMKTECCGTLSR